MCLCLFVCNFFVCVRCLIACAYFICVFCVLPVCCVLSGCFDCCWCCCAIRVARFVFVIVGVCVVFFLMCVLVFV